jgi:hypothetical protein
VATGLTVSSATATTSGTDFDVTGIPSTAKRITILTRGVSFSNTSVPIIQIGNGSIQTTGYTAVGIGYGSGGVGGADFTTGFPAQDTGNAAFDHDIVWVLYKENGNNWTYVAKSRRGSAAGGTGNGKKTLTGTLDRFRLTSNTGGTFDGGEFSYIVES